MISDVYLFFQRFLCPLLANRHLSSNQVKLERYAFLLFFSPYKQNSTNVRVHGTVLMYVNKSVLFFAYFCVFTDIVCSCVPPNSASCISVPQVKKGCGALS